MLERRAGKPDKAIERLRAAANYQFSQPARLANYVRGLSYLDNKSGAEAVAEFQKIIDHRGLQPLSSLHPLSYLGLARAYTLTQNVPEARKYEEFLKIWKDADPDIPLLVQARREYAKLAATK